MNDATNNNDPSAAKSQPHAPRAGGAGVLLTRPRGQTQAADERLTDHGFRVLVQPVIEIGPPRDWRPVDEAIERIDHFDWVVFSSANGVRAFLQRVSERSDLRRLEDVSLAAIGPSTADAMAEWDRRADLIPESYRAESLAEALIARIRADAKRSETRVLLIRASRGREVLAERLRDAGIDVHQVVAYSSEDTQAPAEATIEALGAGEIDWVTVTSSAIARSLVQLFGERLRTVRLASISPITSQTLVELGYPPTVQASEYTLDGLIDAMVAFDRAQ